MYLKELRIKHRYTQERLAKELGVTQSAICQWECGRRHPSYFTLSELSAIFHCSIDEIVKGETARTADKA